MSKTKRAIAFRFLANQVKRSSQILEARIRHSLKIKDWSSVLVLINLLSEEKKNLEQWKYWNARVLSQSEELADREVAQDIFSKLSRSRSFYGF